MDLVTLLPRIRKSPKSGAALAVALLFFATAMRMNTPITLTYATYYPAVILATIAGGRWLGLAAIALAVFTAIYFFVDPPGSLALRNVDIWNAGAFIIVSLIIVVLTELLVETLLVTNTKSLKLVAIEKQQQFLMRELSHRMKNQYSVILAMARASERSAETVPEFQKAFSERLHSLARTHDLLTSSEWKAVSLRDMISSELDAFVLPGRLQLDGPDVQLKESAVVNLAMALHELATNSAKHGAWSGKAGKVTIRWTFSGQQFRLVWEESDGPEVKDAIRKGFGRAMLEDVVPNALKGSATLEFAADGICWTLTAPDDDLFVREGLKHSAGDDESSST